MLTLSIEARYGSAFLADATLYDASGRVMAKGQCVIASRRHYAEIAEGQYWLTRKVDFPEGDEFADNWGSKGLLFEQRPGSGEPGVLVHAGALEKDGKISPTFGSIRLDDAIVQAVDRSTNELKPLQKQVKMIVEIGERAPSWQFWRQPSSTEQVCRDDDNIDMFDVVCPSLAPFRHPSSGAAWLLYFEDRERKDELEAQRRRADEAQQQLEQERMRERQQGQFNAAQGSQDWDASTDANSNVQPLFQMQTPPGVDQNGAVCSESSRAPCAMPNTDAQEPQGADQPSSECRASDASSDAGSTRDDCVTSTAY